MIAKRKNESSLQPNKCCKNQRHLIESTKTYSQSNTMHSENNLELPIINEDSIVPQVTQILNQTTTEVKQSKHLKMMTTLQPQKVEIDFFQ